MRKAPDKPVRILYPIILLVTLLFIAVAIIFIVMISQEQIHVDTKYLNWTYAFLISFILASLLTLSSATYEFIIADNDQEKY